MKREAIERINDEKKKRRTKWMKNKLRMNKNERKINENELMKEWTNGGTKKCTDTWMDEYMNQGMNEKR